MIDVKLTFPGWPIERQTPGHRGIWGDCRFLCNRPVGRCDYWVVCEGLEKSENTVCPRENTILVTNEPKTIKIYPEEFLNQFATIITSQPDIDHPNSVFSQTGLPWHVGRRQKNHVNLSWSKDYDELSSSPPPAKDKLISVVASSKDNSQGHRNRLMFVSALNAHFGDTIDIFGRGINEIEDKWDALAPYRYHVAIENCAAPNYWTEKLSDAYLAGCHPIYYGCPNIGDYFNPRSLTQIDIADPGGAIRMIEACIRRSAYDRSRPEILIARKRVLDEHNLFALLSGFIRRQAEQKTVDPPYVAVRLRKEPSRSNLLYRLKRLFAAGRR